MKDEDFENIDPGEQRILMPEGVYQAKWRERDTKPYVGWGEKLIDQWTILPSGLILCRYYNLKRNKACRRASG